MEDDDEEDNDELSDVQSDVGSESGEGIDYDTDDEPAYEIPPRRTGWSSYTLEEMEDILKRAPTQKHSTVIHAYRRLPDYEPSYRKVLQRMKKYVRQGGTSWYKYLLVREHTLEQFIKWKQERLIVHDRDMRDIALREARRLKLKNFKASREWVRRFKLANGIVDR